MRVACPHCGFQGQTRTPPSNGAKMRCTKCGETFTHRAEPVFVETLRRPRSRSRIFYALISGFGVAALASASFVVFFVANAPSETPPAILFRTMPMIVFVAAVWSSPFGLVWGAITWTGAYIADQRGRERFEGALFAMFLGPLGLLIEACLPDERD